MGAELGADMLNADIDASAAQTGIKSWPPRAWSDAALSALHARLPWLDQGTAELIVGVAGDLARVHPEVQTVILFGSLARHEERPLGMARPSDVDLLVLVRATPGPSGAKIPLEHKLGIYHTIGEREYRHPHPSLGVQAVLAVETLADWDERFVANVAREGVLLWTRVPLSDMLAPLLRGVLSSPYLIHLPESACAAKKTSIRDSGTEENVYAWERRQG